MSQHPATRALRNLRACTDDKVLASYFNTSVANLDRNCRGGSGYEDGPNLPHAQIYQLHLEKLPNSSGFIHELTETA